MAKRMWNHGRRQRAAYSRESPRPHAGARERTTALDSLAEHEVHWNICCFSGHPAGRTRIALAHRLIRALRRVFAA